MMRLRPETIGQANRLPGLTPAAVVAVLRHLNRQQAAEARSSVNDAPEADAPEADAPEARVQAQAPATRG